MSKRGYLLGIAMSVGILAGYTVYPSVIGSKPVSSKHTHSTQKKKAVSPVADQKRNAATPAEQPEPIDPPQPEPSAATPAQPEPAPVQPEPQPAATPDTPQEPEPAPAPEPEPATPDEPAPIADEPEPEPETTADEPAAPDIPDLVSATRTPAQLKQLQQYLKHLASIKETPFIGKEFNGTAWSKADSIQRKLASRIGKNLGNRSDKDIMAFLSKPQNRLDLAQWQLIQHAGADKISSLASTPDGRSFLSAFANNLEWLEGFLFSGPVGNADKALSILSDIVKEAPDTVSDPMLRKIAAATSAEFARSGWEHDKAIARNKFYASSWKEGKLNREFDNLDYWDMRIVCGCKGNNGFGNVESLTWQRDNVRLPAEQYTGACWQAPYRLNNISGDSIHGADYYRPYDRFFSGNQAQMTRDVGGVCGGLSHYGAFAACANGIPALPMGEPGHCAYTVRVNGKWTPAYSLSWQRGAHWCFWDEHTWAFLELTQALYSDHFRTRISDQVSAIARFLTATNKQNTAIGLYELATDIQPLNFPVWREYCGLVKTKAPNDAKKWTQINDAVCKAFAPDFSDVCAQTLMKHVYPQLFQCVKTPTDRLKIFHTSLKQFDNMGSCRWDVENFLNKQIEQVRDKNKPNEKLLMDYLRVVMGNMMNKPAFASIALAWGQGQAAQEKPAFQQAFTKMTLQAMGASRMDKDAKDKLLAAALIGAENSKDLTTFQTVGKMLKHKYKDSLPKIDPCSPAKTFPPAASSA